LHERHRNLATIMISARDRKRYDHLLPDVKVNSMAANTQNYL